MLAALIRSSLLLAWACGGGGDEARATPSAPDAEDARAERFHEWRGPAFGEFSLDALERAGAVVQLPAGAGSWGFDMSGLYNGGEYRVGAALSPDVVTKQPFREAVVSWEADTPPGSWIEILIAARQGEHWTRDYHLGVWAATSDAVVRHSVAGQEDEDGKVATDTLALRRPADGYRVTVRLYAASEAQTPALRAVAVATSKPDAERPALAPHPAAWGRALDVPGRSQRNYPDGGEVWCSPTSTSMVLAYWARELGRGDLLETVPEAADATYDAVYDGNGNWPFNTAHAASLGGGALRAFVTRLDRVEQLERLTAAGFPVIVSAAWDEGQLAAAPIKSTNGHLLVVRGFDQRGNVLVNDPAGEGDEAVRFAYDRGQFDAAWSRSHRTAYLIHPVDRALPRDGALGAW